MFKIVVVVVVALFLACDSQVVAADEQGSDDDKFYVELNPNCPAPDCSKTDEVAVVYTRQSKPKYDLHHFWSTINVDKKQAAAPGFVVAQSEPGQEPTINWDQLLKYEKDSISLKMDNAIGIVVTKLYIFNDTDNDGTVPKFDNATYVLPWQALKFKDVKPSLPKQLNGTERASATFRYTAPSPSELDISLTLFASISSGQNDVVPRLLYSDTSFHIEAVVKGKLMAPLSLELKNQRIGIEFALIHAKGSFSPDRIKSIDDEYSPGVFTKMLAKFEADGQKSYITWKPVAYMKSERLVAQTVDAVLQSPKKDDSSKVPEDNAVVYGLFADDSKMEVSTFGFTIGSAKDIMYSDTNFTSMSFVVGLGEAPNEALSTLVEMIILVGFGLPAVFILLGGVYIVVKRVRRRRAGPRLLDASQ